MSPSKDAVNLGNNHRRKIYQKHKITPPHKQRISPKELEKMLICIYCPVLLLEEEMMNLLQSKALS